MERDPADEVHAAAAHILAALSEVQDRLELIRKTAEKLARQQEGDDDAADV